MARASINIGVAQLALKKYEEALQCQLTALKIAEKLDDNEMRGNVMGNLGKELFHDLNCREIWQSSHSTTAQIQ